MLIGAALPSSLNLLYLDPDSTDATPGAITLSSGRKKMLSISALIAIGAAAAIVVGEIVVTVLNLRVRASTSHSAGAFAFSGGHDFFSHSSSPNEDSGKLVMFSGNPDFSTGTHSLLNKDCELGRGGFVVVGSYHTMLRNGYSVAIEKLAVSSLVKSQEDFKKNGKKLGKIRQCLEMGVRLPSRNSLFKAFKSQEDFEKEGKKLGKIREGNLVSLNGYYWTPSLQLLIHEYVSGENLFKLLHEGSGENLLNWNERFKILLGAAKWLAHLHQTNTIHYNIKSSNVLIDSFGEPKVADYGLARLLPTLDRYVLSSKIQSAPRLHGN